MSHAAGPGAPAPSTPPADPGPRPRRRPAVLAATVGGLVAAAAIIGGLVWWSRTPPSIDRAGPGQCVRQINENDLAVIDCANSDAEFTILGKVENVAEDEADNGTVCDDFPDATSTYWHPVDGGRGFALCLGPTG